MWGAFNGEMQVRLRVSELEKFFEKFSNQRYAESRVKFGELNLSSLPIVRAEILMRAWWKLLFVLSL